MSSGADIFPLPLSVPPSATIDGILSNGINGAATNYSLFNDTGLGSDESLGGALLTPIPWLSNAPSPSSTEHGLSQTTASADSTIIAVLAGDESGIHNAPPETTEADKAPNDNTEDDDIPHARGPSIIGVEDMGLQEGKDVHMTLLPVESESTGKDHQSAEQTENGKTEIAGSGEDRDGDIVIADVLGASEAGIGAMNKGTSTTALNTTSTGPDATDKTEDD